MIYAQFWHKGVSGKLTPACGSDSVLIIDGRLGVARQHKAARDRLKQDFYARKYTAYTLHAGRSFTDSRCLMSLPALPESGIVALEDVSPAYIERGRVAAHA